MNRPYYYQEITCLPDQEISSGFVLGRVMDAVHLAMVNITAAGEACPVGISFPEYRVLSAEPPPIGAGPPIGSKIRLFSRAEPDLVGLNLAGQLSRLSDYVHWTSVRLLERRLTRYAIYQRRQTKSSKERLMRRQMKRQGLSEAEVQERYATFRPRHCELPYVNLRSHSTGERFRLFVDRQDAAAATDAWGFSTYGLSAAVPVPHF